MSLVFIVEVLIFILTIVVIHFYRKRKVYMSSWKFPGPIWLPFLGNALTFFCKDEDFFDVATKLCSTYPSPMRFWFGTEMAVIVTDVQQAEKVMSSVKLITKGDIYDFIATLSGRGLITSSGMKWKRDRRLLAPLFLKKNTVQYFPSILDNTKKLVEILEKRVDESTFNVLPFIHRCVVDFVTETQIGIKSNFQFGENEELLASFKRAYVIVQWRIFKVWLQSEILFKLSPYWKQYQETKQNIYNFFTKAVQIAESKHTYCVNANLAFRPYIDHMIDIKKELPDFTTNEEMLHHLITFYSAAEDTITVITSFALVLLGMYPEIQNKVVDEIHSVLGRTKRNIEEVDLSKLEYLDMVIKEVLRLFPIAPFIIRKLQEEYILDGKIIPAGCSVVVCIHNIHRDEKHWEKPNEFYPEHFLQEAVTNRHPYAFMAFSAGPRGCPGKPFAYMALKILLVTILQSFIIESDGKLEDIKLKQDISVRIKNDQYSIRLNKRE